MGLLGLLSILALAYALSRNRRAIKPSLVLWGLGLQILLAVLVLKTPFGAVFQALGGAINRMMQLAEDGSIFVFGDFGKSDGPLGIVLAFQILPLIVFVSSLFAVLYYLGIMQWVVRGIAVVMQTRVGRERRRVVERRRQHLHGTVRSPAHDPSLSFSAYEFRVDDGHDRRHGDQFPGRCWSPMCASAGSPSNIC